jgi:hypothetical protein
VTNRPSAMGSNYTGRTGPEALSSQGMLRGPLMVSHACCHQFWCCSTRGEAEQAHLFEGMQLQISISGPAAWIPQFLGRCCHPGFGHSGCSDEPQESRHGTSGLQRWLTEVIIAMLHVHHRILLKTHQHVCLRARDQQNQPRGIGVDASQTGRHVSLLLAADVTSWSNALQVAIYKH